MKQDFPGTLLWKISTYVWVYTVIINIGGGGMDLTLWNTEKCNYFLEWHTETWGLLKDSWGRCWGQSGERGKEGKVMLSQVYIFLIILLNPKKIPKYLVQWLFVCFWIVAQQFFVFSLVDILMTQGPPTPLIFSLALLLKNLTFTITGCSGSFPFSRTLK